MGDVKIAIEPHGKSATVSVPRLTVDDIDRTGKVSHILELHMRNLSLYFPATWNCSYIIKLCTTLQWTCWTTDKDTEDFVTV